MKDIFKNKKFWITVAIIAFVLLLIWAFLWVRQSKCSTGVYPWQRSPLSRPAIECSFWTGKPVTASEQRQTGNNCCKDAEGRSCYPCTSISCCGAGFRAGYLTNRDILQQSVAK